MPTKQFKSKRDARPPLDFELVYEKKIAGEWVEQTGKFRARPSVPGTTLLRIARAMKKGRGDDVEAIGMAASELIELLEQAILPEDKIEFFAVLDDPDTAIQIETLGEILEWLSEEYAENPTQKP